MPVTQWQTLLQGCILNLNNYSFYEFISYRGKIKKIVFKSFNCGKYNIVIHSVKILKKALLRVSSKAYN